MASSHHRDPAREAPGATEYVFKIVVLGDYGCGKSCLLHQWQTASANVEGDAAAVIDRANGGCDAGTPGATVGVDLVAILLREVTPSTDFRMQFWDTAATERDTLVGTTSRRNAAAAVVVCDAAHPASLSAVDDVWIPLAITAGVPLQRVLVVVNGSNGSSNPSQARQFSSNLVASVDCRTGAGSGDALYGLVASLHADFVEVTTDGAAPQPQQVVQQQVQPTERATVKQPAIPRGQERPSDVAPRAQEPLVVRVDSSSGPPTEDSSKVSEVSVDNPRRRGKKQKSGACCC
jgi:signal recognition particle receptor subunit beta